MGMYYSREAASLSRNRGVGENFGPQSTSPYDAGSAEVAESC